MASAEPELFSSDCPLYCICRLRGEEFCVTGGGGAGVPNLLEVYRLSHDGVSLLAEHVHRHSCGTQLVMNASCHPQRPHTLAAGMGDSCHLLSLRPEGEEEEEEPASGDGWDVHSLRSVQTDFDEKEPYQKAVRFSHDGSLLVTGGTDGVVRCWKYPNLEKLHDLTGHKTEIEDLACHAHKLQAVSVCRHGDAIVWDLEGGEKEAEFTWSPDTQSQKKTYRFRTCCFSPKEASPAHFFSINVPLKWNPRQKQSCYVVKWDADSWQPIRSQKTGGELLSALAVDPTGSWLGVGTANGTVAIFNSELNLIKKVSSVHTWFVTDMAFVTAGSQTAKMEKDAKTPSTARPKRTVLLSVSADKLCCVTDLQSRGYFRADVLTFVLIPVLVFLIAMVIRMLSGSL